MKIHTYIYSCVALAVLLLTSCGSMGPKSIRAGRMEYNLALGKSDSEQLLINIVKMRFLDRPVFLNITSMTSNLSFQSELSASTSALFQSTTLPISASPSFTWKDNPTITYQELTGAKYVTQMLSPVPADTIVLLLQSWPADMVLPLTLNEINNVNNIWNPIDPNLSSDALDEHKRFTAITKSIQLLDSQRTLEWVVTRKIGDVNNTVETAILLNRPNDKITTAAVQTLIDNLGLTKAEKGTTKFSVEYGLEQKDDSTIVFGTRSVQDILSFASMDVDVPVSMATQALPVEKGWGEPAGTRSFHVQTSSTKPNNASIAIQYRNNWFYISENDLKSKATFLLLQVLMGMQSGTSSNGTPVLTIPISS